MISCRVAVAGADVKPWPISSVCKNAGEAGKLSMPPAALLELPMSHGEEITMSPMLILEVFLDEGSGGQSIAGKYQSRPMELSYRLETC